MILTEVGEVGVHMGDRSHVLRPSLYAVSKIGSPQEVVAAYASVMATIPHPQQFSDALAVVYACSEDDISDLYGYHEPAESGIRYVPGLAPADHVVPLAQCLLKHGIVGALPALPRSSDDEPEFVQEFDARAHVALAMAHLGISERDAWQMTMTSLVGALRAKFPPAESNAPGAKAPSKAEMEATMEWFDRVEAARQAKRGA